MVLPSPLSHPSPLQSSWHQAPVVFTEPPATSELFSCSSLLLPASESVPEKSFREPNPSDSAFVVIGTVKPTYAAFPQGQKAVSNSADLTLKLEDSMEALHSRFPHPESVPEAVIPESIPEREIPVSFPNIYARLY